MDESSFYEEFARRVRRRRQVVGLSGAAVAREIGVTQPQYNRLERGKQHGLQLYRLARLAQVLQTTTDYLLALSDDAGPVPPPRSPGEGPSLDGTAPLPVTIAREGHTVDAQYT